MNELLTQAVMLDLLKAAYVRDNADRIADSAKSGTNMFV